MSLLAFCATAAKWALFFAFKSPDCSSSLKKSLLTHVRSTMRHAPNNKAIPPSQQNSHLPYAWELQCQSAKSRTQHQLACQQGLAEARLSPAPCLLAHSRRSRGCMCPPLAVILTCEACSDGDAAHLHFRQLIQQLFPSCQVQIA